jgi:hypothetical protein
VAERGVFDTIKANEMSDEILNPVLKKDFLLFLYENHAANGGLSDVICGYDSLEEAIEAVRSGDLEVDEDNEAYVYDQVKREIVYEFPY